MAAKSDLQSLNSATSDRAACTTSVALDLKSELGLRRGLLRESQESLLPAGGRYPRHTAGKLLFPAVDVEVFHGRPGGLCAMQVSSPYAISGYQVDLCRKQLFADACKVRIACLEISFKVRDFSAGGNGSGSATSYARMHQDGKRAVPKFRRNSIGLPWHVEWDADARVLHIHVILPRDFLAGYGIATLADIRGLRGLKLGALLTSDDICRLPVGSTFSKSREALTERFEGMLAEFFF